MQRLLPLLGLTFVLLGCSSDKGFDTQEVGRSDYGADWPLTVDEAILACEPGDVTTVTVDGRSYPLDVRPDEVANGFGRIWAEDPDGGARIDLAPLTDDAEALCD